MVINNMLYQNSSNALMQAKHYQSQISQKEFEMQLININNKYSSYGNDYNEMQKRKLEQDIWNLKNIRNNNIYSAIDYALELVLIEIKGTPLYSMAYLAVNSITSYLKIQKISDLTLPFSLRLKLTQTDTNLAYSNMNNTMLKNAISELKNLFHIF